MPAETTTEHQWLQRMAGEWSFAMEAEGQPGEPPITDSGTERVRSLHGVWMLCESQGTAPGGGAETSIMTLGYDPAAQRFTGTFISSMMTHLWLYSGTLDAGGTTLTLDTEGPSYTGEAKMSKYRDTIELRGGDHRVHTSAYQRDDGSWHQFMTVHYRRTG
ncbi:MAG TPA: DUF1579 domain-containing protein [Longimicrobium sp.]|nr:DUF1579 domain-containing protein [Longimicrobium sp.]